MFRGQGGAKSWGDWRSTEVKSRRSQAWNGGQPQGQGRVMEGQESGSGQKGDGSQERLGKGNKQGRWPQERLVQRKPNELSKPAGLGIIDKREF